MSDEGFGAGILFGAVLVATLVVPVGCDIGARRENVKCNKVRNITKHHVTRMDNENWMWVEKEKVSIQITDDEVFRMADREKRND